MPTEVTKRKLTQDSFYIKKNSAATFVVVCAGDTDIAVLLLACSTPREGGLYYNE